MRGRGARLIRHLRRERHRALDRVLRQRDALRAGDGIDLGHQTAEERHQLGVGPDLAKPATRGGGGAADGVEQKKLLPQVHGHIGAIGRIDPRRAERLDHRPDARVGLLPLDVADGKAAAAAILRDHARRGDVGKDPRDPGQGVARAKCRRQKIGCIYPVLERQDQRFGLRMGPIGGHHLFKVLPLDREDGQIGGRQRGKVIADGGGVDDRLAPALDQLQPVAADRLKMRAPREEKDAMPRRDQLCRQKAADPAGPDHQDVHASPPCAHVPQAARAARIRPRISFAAAGIFVPGPKIALTPAFFRNS